MKYPQLYATFYNTPHAVTPEKLAEIEAYLVGRFHPRIIEREAAFDAEGNPLRNSRGDTITAVVHTSTAGPRDNVQMVGRVAVVNIFGTIAQRMGMMQAASGGTSTEQLGATIDNLVADRGVRSIVLNVDSPGGSVYGVQEIADKILRAREEKRVTAVANSVAASAAYWIASQASEFVVTPSGQVGSIGVIAAHVDESKAEEAAGVKTTYITAGKFKGEGVMPLTDDATKALQAAVDQYYGMFVNAVAKGRGVTAHRVEQDFGQGRMVLAKDAAANGMVDRVATLETTLQRLGGNESASASRDRAAQLVGMGLPTM